MDLEEVTFEYSISAGGIIDGHSGSMITNFFCLEIDGLNNNNMWFKDQPLIVFPLLLSTHEILSMM